MYRMGKAIADIAIERQLALSTIEAHLSYYITTGQLGVDEFVPADKQELIAEAITKYGALSLKLLKDNLPEEISYGEIRLVLADLSRQAGQ